MWPVVILLPRWEKLQAFVRVNIGQRVDRSSYSPFTREESNPLMLAVKRGSIKKRLRINIPLLDALSAYTLNLLEAAYPGSSTNIQCGHILQASMPAEQALFELKNWRKSLGGGSGGRKSINSGRTIYRIFKEPFTTKAASVQAAG